MFKRYTSYLAWIFLALFATTEVAQAELCQDQHCERALRFLEMLDNEQYEPGWVITSALFKLLNDQHEWQRHQQAIRDVYGTPPVRSIRDTRQRPTFTNSPDGNYVIVQFDSVFPHKAKAIETVVLDCQTTPECAVREYTIN